MVHYDPINGLAIHTYVMNHFILFYWARRARTAHRLILLQMYPLSNNSTTYLCKLLALLCLSL
jgi:hypothetical protein